MNHRPVDDAGDILPVLSSADLLRGPLAVAQLVRERLDLLTGDWWENPAAGNEIPEMLRESGRMEAECRALAAYLSSYIRETPGVQEVSDAAFSATGKRFFFSCTVITENDSFTINSEF